MFACFWLALGAYAAFFLLAIISRVGASPSPQASFHRLHLRASILYLIGYAGWLLRRAGPFDILLVSDFFIGLFFYFAFHYAVVGPFFVIAQASVSTSLLSIIHENGGKAIRDQCLAAYGGGRGFAFIKEQRMARVQRMLGWIIIHDGKYVLTRKGAAVAKLTLFFLNLWGLRQLGSAPKERMCVATDKPRAD
ncbi:MAG: hypothetical protein C5B50_08935 [Verrucomicrobia bacterium]|nr:MAG: hypothetical protein C5B50_08935 [Verrucomicrobiota bacterium]